MSTCLYQNTLASQSCCAASAYAWRTIVSWRASDTSSVGPPNSVTQIGLAASPLAVMIERRLGDVSPIWLQPDHSANVPGQSKSSQ